MEVRMNKHKVWSLLSFLLFTLVVFSKDLPPVSKTLVNDYAGILGVDERQLLEQKLVAYFDSTSTQIAVVIENSLEGDDLFDYCQRLSTAWGIGEKGKNNGLLIYVAVKDRQSRIHTGYGMEATITDALSARIRTELMNPNFKVGDFYTGLDLATTTIMKAASGEYINEREKGGKKFPFKAILIVIVLLLIFSKFGGGGGKGRRSRFGGPILWGGTFGSGGFSSGGGGGGGFGGFGGGGFGGGGSGGSW